MSATLALESETVITPAIADTLSATSLPVTLAQVLANIGPFFTSDGQFASFCAMAFDEDAARGEIA